MRILICGDRNWNNYSIIQEVIERIPSGSVVIHGGARGADRIAGELARKHGLDVIERESDWLTHGKAAGPIRNRTMLDLNPDYVVAFHPDLSKSKGTRDCVTEAIKRGIIVHVIGDIRGTRMLPWERDLSESSRPPRPAVADDRIDG